MRYGLTRGTWIKLHCGDKVCDVADERHVGVVENIERGVIATVRWEKTGWISHVFTHALKKVRE